MVLQDYGTKLKRIVGESTPESKEMSNNALSGALFLEQNINKIMFIIIPFYLLVSHLPNNSSI